MKLWKSLIMVCPPFPSSWKQKFALSRTSPHLPLLLIFRLALMMIELTELFANHTYVGMVDGWRRLAAIQHGVKLYLVDYGAVWYPLPIPTHPSQSLQPSYSSQLRILLPTRPFRIRQLRHHRIRRTTTHPRPPHHSNGSRRRNSQGNSI